MTTQHTKTLDPETVKMAAQHVGVLVLAKEYRLAAAVEAELKDRFIHAMAARTCTAPAACAKEIEALKALDYPREQEGRPEHKLDAILGRHADHARRPAA